MDSLHSLSNDPRNTGICQYMIQGLCPTIQGDGQITNVCRQYLDLDMETRERNKDVCRAGYDVVADAHRTYVNAVFQGVMFGLLEID